MSEITFDLATKVVAKGQVIWAIFPGRGRRLLDIFLEGKSIFLEVPGIDLLPAILEDDTLLRKHVAMSGAIAAYHSGATTSAPSRRASTYPVTRNASFNAAVGNVRNMYAKMKPGDLVVMGGKSLYQPVLAGEIEGEFDPREHVQLPSYPRENIPFRNVRWFGGRPERRFCSERLSHLLSNRKAIISINKEEFGDEVYTLVYGDYVFGEDSRYVFSGPKYNNIATSTVPGIELISYFIAAFNACELKEGDDFSKLDIGVATSNYFEQDMLHSFELEFSSPGAYVVHAKRATLPLILALLVSATSGTMTFDEASAAAVVNSASSGSGPSSANATPVDIQAKFRSIMVSIGAEKFNKLVKLNKDAQAGVGLKVRVKQRRTKK